MYKNIKTALTDLNLTLDKSIKVSVVNQISKLSDLCNDIISSTDFLHSDANLKTRLVVIRDDIETPPVCGNCGNPVHITTSGKKAYTFPPFCSRKCASSDASTRNKVSATNIDRYGVDNVFKSSTIKQKISQTINERYGVDSPLQSPVIKQRFVDTMRSKYGVDNAALSPELKSKKQETNIDRYGYRNVFADPNVIEQIKVTNMSKYGTAHPNQKHLSQQTIQHLNDRNWLYDQHYVKKNTLSTIAQKLECDVVTVSRHLSTADLQTQYFFRSTGEQEVGDFIRSLGVDIIVNNRSIISPYELDIYLPSLKIAIEYCGVYWHSEQQGKDRHYHKRKHQMCADKGIQLLTIFDDEWQKRQQQVQRKIANILHIPEKFVYARKTAIVMVDTPTKKAFFDEHHIQGNGPGSIHLGLKYDTQLIACMSFIKQQNVHYLNRFATSCRVVGGFSKLLHHFTSNYKWDNIISFADMRWSAGNLYEAAGWQLDSVLPPDYSYSINGIDRIHKFNFRRKYLNKKLPIFDESLSEKQNCDANGILRIWDCGKLKYKYQKR